MLMLASSSREAARELTGSVWEFHLSDFRLCVGQALGIEHRLDSRWIVTRKRVTLFPPMGKEWKARMLMLRSASARQTFASVPGRSSIKTVNSLDVGMVGTSFVSKNAGCILRLE